MHLKMVSAQWQQFGSGLNVLKHWLTRYGLVTPHGDIDLVQHTVDLSTKVTYGIQQRGISQESTCELHP